MATADGSATLRSGVILGADGAGETYHSLRGAVGEARHVFIEAGFRFTAFRGDAPTRTDEVTQFSGPRAGSKCEEGVSVGASEQSVRVFEAGWGTGLNCWLTLLEAERSGRQVDYIGVEKYPVAQAVAARLGYDFDALHAAPWNEWVELSPRFRLLKIEGDLTQSDGIFGEGSTVFDVVYWDAFAPDVQPELWTPEIFARVYGAMADGGVLVTYSAKGDVRRALQAAGFKVEKLTGALGKRHMTRATKSVNFFDTTVQ